MLCKGENGQLDGLIPQFGGFLVLWDDYLLNQWQAKTLQCSTLFIIVIRPSHSRYLLGEAILFTLMKMSGFLYLKLAVSRQKLHIGSGKNAAGILPELEWRICILSYRRSNRVLTSCRTVFTTSLLETCPTSISPIKTANLRLSLIAIRTTSSGCLMSLKGGFVKSAIFAEFLQHNWTALPDHGLLHVHKKIEISPISEHSVTIFLPCWVANWHNKSCS